MANFRTSITADGTYAIATVKKPRSLSAYLATIVAYGTFGGGTLTYLISTNGGTNKVNLKDLSGSTISSTADDNVNVELGVANKLGDEPILYVTLAGATGASITVDVLDNT